MKRYITNVEIVRDGNPIPFIDHAIHETFQDFLKYMNDIRTIYSRMGYSIERLIRSTSNAIDVNYYIRYHGKELRLNNV